MSNGDSPSDRDKPRVALITGPTASGKSDLALRLAVHIQQSGGRAAIINADSAQVYRDLNILSAAPSAEDRSMVDHYLYGDWDGATPCNTVDWAQRAKQHIDTFHAHGTTPIVVGGTGLYIRTLLEGIAPVPPIAADIRETIRALPQDEAYHQLEQEDPEKAAHLHPADSTRIKRALEVVRATGKSLTYWQARKTGGIGERICLRACVALPERDWLYDRCNQRFAWMVDNGAVEEVQALLARDLDPALPVMRAIGVSEISDWLIGNVSHGQAVAAGQQATRNYAKRQYTWFRRQAPEEWPRISTKTPVNDLEIARIFQ